jgi:hypothetical protein
MIVDKRSNLARGFADNHTPSRSAHELLMSYRTKRADIARRIHDYQKVLRELPKTKKNIGLRNAAKKELDEQIQKARALAKKRREHADVNRFLVARLRKFVSNEVFHQQAMLAELDEATVLEQMSIDDDELIKGIA